MDPYSDYGSPAPVTRSSSGTRCSSADSAGVAGAGEARCAEPYPLVIDGEVRRPCCAAASRGASVLRVPTDGPARVARPGGGALHVTQLQDWHCCGRTAGT